jgi:hypothetical protein
MNNAAEKKQEKGRGDREMKGIIKKIKEERENRKNQKVGGR